MRLLLAPMEGLLDAPLRDVLTRVGGVDRCVSEFIRVTGTLLPERAFLRVVPELANGSRTTAGVPVRPQLLGSDAACLADNAGRLAEMGAEGVDLNFGCPAAVVNRHGGGAALLQDPEQLAPLVAAVRRAVPAHLPVSAKMRLGYADDRLALDCARALVAGGASELVVHGRTKAQGYRPPAWWDRIAEVREAVAVPVVANGEIWNVDDALRCQRESGCADLMLGRGIVADPGLAWAVRAAVAPAWHASAGQPAGCDWATLEPLIGVHWQLTEPRVAPRHRAGRLKQWLNLLRRVHPEAQAAFDELRTVTDPRAIEPILRRGWLGTAGAVGPVGEIPSPPVAGPQEPVARSTGHNPTPRQPVDCLDAA
ncbi:tRNA dihydrouridine synthase [Leptothrix discophora]|uniref:tRNA-dihydrouridine(16) synthase n=1 Tax=Leptothrix discophora TaxID=89 RepID=A0ABT9G1G3_LEPDI|nr:tRNA-dihydrouridine synthase [Leptothrix discophora]MDP4300322.1 tRNA-dihydrouridine synthase [Leptothrix discophora]